MSTTMTETAPRATSGSNASGVTPELIARFKKDFEANPSHRTLQNAVTAVTVDDIALDRELLNQMHHSFSHHLDSWEATHQKKSGRCWMFAGLNLLRVGAMEKMNLQNFEFSQNYTFFWDKFERANHALEFFIETADRDADDRTVAYMLRQMVNDGGQWNMFVNVINKHGLVPKTVMPESESSSNTPRMNSIVKRKLREGAMVLRNLVRDGADAETLQAKKNEFLAVIYRILAIHLGTPPQSFDWQWQDKDKEFHRDGVMTPQQFAEKYVTIPLDEYVCLVHDPRESSPYGKTYTVECLGNVVGAEIVKYLNVDADLMKKLTMESIIGGEPVWFGCDCGKQMRRDLGLWDVKLLDYGRVYETDFPMTKAERLVYHETQMTHAMVFTGVDVVDGSPRRWRVENSWGDENGVKGFYNMNDSWFDEYVFEIAVRKSALPQELQKACDLEPAVLPAWDPMGALAQE